VSRSGERILTGLLIYLGRIVNNLERQLGIDLNGDGYIGGEGRRCFFLSSILSFVPFRLLEYDGKDDWYRLQW
jgi:hypothetical protein